MLSSESCHMSKEPARFAHEEGPDHQVSCSCRYRYGFRDLCKDCASLPALSSYPYFNRTALSEHGPSSECTSSVSSSTEVRSTSVTRKSGLFFALIEVGKDFRLSVNTSSLMQSSISTFLDRSKLTFRFFF